MFDCPLITLYPQTQRPAWGVINKSDLSMPFIESTDMWSLMFLRPFVREAR